MNQGTFGLHRTGHGGIGRAGNINAAKNYFKQFLQSDFVKLMNEDDDMELESWIESNITAEAALCDIEVIQQFATWLCDYARKVNREPLMMGSIADILSSRGSH